MLKVLAIIFTEVVSSFYFFPFEFAFLPGVNTKMIMAACGLVILGINLARERNALINKDWFQLSIWGIVVSVIGLISITYNDTPDYTYATYIISMWVWLGGAYTVTRLIKWVHGQVSIQLVCYYLIAVCVTQCIIAFAMGQFPYLKQFVDSFLASEGFMGKVKGRLYGIGASLDVAGMRFAAVLLMIAYFVVNSCKKQSVYWVIGSGIAFWIISVIGCMIGRTTSIGIIAALSYWIMVNIFSKGNKENIKSFMPYFLSISAFFLLAVVYLYHTNIEVYNNIRFGFEGFFSLWEKGRWEVSSNEILKDMYIFPSELKTWIIGDGYFDKPDKIDPTYIAHYWGGEHTDVGYLRFIFYFGLIGMLAFAFYMCKAAWICKNHFPNQWLLFVAVLFLNYIVWFKVSSDLFLVFALFLCVSQEENEAYMKRISLKES